MALFTSTILAVAEPAGFNPTDPELAKPTANVQPEFVRSLFPPNVKTIALITPASFPGKPLYQQGVRMLESSGLKIKLAKHAFNPNATVEDKLSDFYAAWNDMEVDFILCVRGGGGSQQLLEALDWSKLSPRPNLYLQGYSDVTLITCALQNRNMGHPIAGPMVGAIASQIKSSLQEMSDMHHGRQVGPVKLTALVPGDCEGLPVAGLSQRLLINRDSDSPVITKDRILFIECVNKKPEEFRQSLFDLLDKGFFKDANGVVFCHIIRSGTDAEIEAILKEFAPKTGLPVYKGFPFGHTNNCYTIDFQRKCVIKNNSLTFPAVQ